MTQASGASRQLRPTRTLSTRTNLAALLRQGRFDLGKDPITEAQVQAIARRIRQTVYACEGGITLAFAPNGRRRGLGGSGWASVPSDAAFVVLAPYRPSVASAAEMVRDFHDAGEQIVYDEDRWLADPIVNEQAERGDIPDRELDG